MDFSFPIISTAILIFFILDPFGNIPLILSVLKKVDEKKRSKIILREALLGLGLLIVFLFFGEKFLSVFHLETQAITLSGGVIFFIIGLKMIFPNQNGDEIFVTKSVQEPLIVPIAIPMIAGPGALATLLVLAKTNPNNSTELFGSLMLAWVLSTSVLLFSPVLYKVFRTRGLIALERLMGMLLLIISVQMFTDGIKEFVNSF